jgi:hypothetical protein
LESDDRFQVVENWQDVDSKDKIRLKCNRKTRESILAKAHRPSIIQAYPDFGVEHIRDSFRFKAVVFDVRTAFLFLFILSSQVCCWEVVKLDVDKLLAPKEWGWRFLGCDLRIKSTGQIVECYVVFKVGTMHVHVCA